MTIPVTEEEWPEYLAVKQIFQVAAADYQLWRELFFDEEALACIKGVGNQFAYYIYTALHRSVVIQLAALHDKSTTGNNANITFESLIPPAEQWLSPTSLKQFNEHLSDLDKQVPALRKYRNKVLAHKDKKSFMSSSHKVSLKHAIIDGVIQSTTKALGVVSFALYGHKNVFEFTPSPSKTFKQAAKNWLWTLQLQSLVKADQFNKEELVDLVLYRWDSRVWIDFANKNEIQNNVFMFGKIYNPFLHGNQ